MAILSAIATESGSLSLAARRGAASAGGAAAPGATAEAVGCYDELDVEIDAAADTIWAFMRPQGPPSYTPGLLRDLAEMRTSLRRLADQRQRRGEPPLRYFVGGSRIPGVFNLGGDLGRFAGWIRDRDRASLETYGRACIDVIHASAVAYDLPLITIALVAGDALGGGFEAALSFDLIVAEKSARFGLPEILFNLFPGMGAYSFLSRRLGSAQAEKLILSGRIYSADELQAIGLVDRVVPDGRGREAVGEHIAASRRRYNAERALYQMRRRVHPVSYAELSDIVDLWVAAALKLEEGDLRKMERLAVAQVRRRAGEMRKAAG